MDQKLSQDLLTEQSRSGIFLPDLFVTLKKLTPKQVYFLNWLHAIVTKGKDQPNFNIWTYKYVLNSDQYASLPDLIKVT